MYLPRRRLDSPVAPVEYVRGSVALLHLAHPFPFNRTIEVTDVASRAADAFGGFVGASYNESRRVRGGAAGPIARAGFAVWRHDKIAAPGIDRKSTRLNSRHASESPT